MKTVPVLIPPRAQAAVLLRSAGLGRARQRPVSDRALRSVLRFVIWLVFVLLGNAHQTCVGSIVWTNASGGTWGNPTNWSPNQVPGPADDAVIAADGTYVVTLDAAATARSLRLGGGSGTQALVNGGNGMTLTGSSIVTSSGALQWSGGTWSGGNLTVNGLLDWNGGTITTAVVITTNGVMNINGTVYLQNALTNSGTVNWLGGDLDVQNSTCWGLSGLIENLAGSLWDVHSDQSLYNDRGYCGTVTALFHNSGTVRKSTGTGTTSISIAFSNSGTVAGLQGTLAFTGSGVIDGSFNALAGNHQLQRQLHRHWGAYPQRRGNLPVYWGNPHADQRRHS